jgi:hypothetical protein
MPEDLTTSNEQEPEGEFELPTPHEDIAAATNALFAIDGIDLAMSSKERSRKIRAIQKMSIDIIYEQLKYIKECIFFEENKEEEED